MINCEQAIDIDGKYQLYNGNAKYLVEDFRDIADCVISDPPYKLISGGNKSAKVGGIFSKKNYNNSGELFNCDLEWEDVMNIFYAGLKEGHCYSMCNDKNILEMLTEAKKTGFHFHNMLVWDKHLPMTNRWYMKHLEFVGFFKKGRVKTINDMGSKQLAMIKPNKVTEHPTEKPVELMKKYILNSTNEGDTVLDPFMGSGATGVACMETNRKFIGFELSPKWFGVAHLRIVAAKVKTQQAAKESYALDN